MRTKGRWKPKKKKKKKGSPESLPRKERLRTFEKRGSINREGDDQPEHPLWKKNRQVDKTNKNGGRTKKKESRSKKPIKISDQFYGARRNSRQWEKGNRGSRVRGREAYITKKITERSTQHQRDGGETGANQTRSEILKQVWGERFSFQKRTVYGPAKGMMKERRRRQVHEDPGVAGARRQNNRRGGKAAKNLSKGEDALAGEIKKLSAVIQQMTGRRTQTLGEGGNRANDRRRGVRGHGEKRLLLGTGSPTLNSLYTD